MSLPERPSYRVLNSGDGEGLSMRLTASLNLWGGLEPETGVIVDPRHPQHGEKLAGRVVLMPPSRGSGTNAQIFAQACARGVGPAAVVLFGNDYVVSVGAMVAKRLYGVACPVVAGPDAQLDDEGEVMLRVSASGSTVSVLPIEEGPRGV